MHVDENHRVTTVAQLEGLLGVPVPRVAQKVRPRLHSRDREWIGASTLCLVATASTDGRCDVSPKGDPAGNFLTLDERTVVLPERPGNRRADGYRNILANPHVGLIFLIPGRRETLRVNGRASLASDGPYFDALELRGHRPRLCLLVDVEEVFFHCGKAFIRAGAWQPDSWEPDGLPAHPALVKEVEKRPEPVEDLEAYYGDSYAQRAYVETAPSDG